MTPQEQMRADGLVHAPADLVPGHFHRFPGRGKRRGNTSGWCCQSLDLAAVFYGCHATDLNETWFRARDNVRDPDWKRHWEAAREASRTAREGAQRKAASRASSIHRNSKVVDPNHPYVVAKSIQPFGASQKGGALVLPLQNFDARLTSVQFIYEDGSKKLLRGGKKKGSFIHIRGCLDHPARIVITEGWATGCTLAAQYPDDTVLAAIDAGNLKSVAVRSRRKWPNVEIVIAADDDRNTPGNPGITKARAAAIASGAQIASPQWPEGCPDTLTDFNDLDIWLRSKTVCEEQL